VDQSVDTEGIKLGRVSDYVEAGAVRLCSVPGNMHEQCADRAEMSLEAAAPGHQIPVDEMLMRGKVVVPALVQYVIVYPSRSIR